ncbi:unnamed protein product [Oppiella nova]|uniref:Uncharacterized protein n=1 Tax=Oppiella nova TaxID=334625 RepID=A0A7R9LMR4_9ACAR|nr:unnamed protein product [Oppiella nova]CAG2164496.1 unnamed protein product [Oppiella nova]
MKKFFGFARRKSSSSLKGLNPRRFSIGSSASSSLQIQVVRGGYNVDLGKVDQSFTKLHKAALLNDEDRVRKQVKAGADVNARDSSDRTALHLATVNGNLSIIRGLVEAGAHVNAQDSDGKTAIVKAIECNHQDLVQYFVCAGADTELADYETGNTPLHWALSMGAVGAAQYLLRNAKQLDVNKRNNQNETCLHLAVKLPQNCVILEDLIANGTHLDARDDRQKTALMIATANENLQAVNTLVKYGSNTYSSDEDMRHTISVNRNNAKNARNLQMSAHETDSADSWPDTEDEDSNYERPMSKESTKARKESFKSNSFRVSSLVDETIVEELKTDENNDNDDYVICKPSTSREENVGDVTNGSQDIKIIWSKSSSDSDDNNVNNKVSESGTFGKIDTLKGRDEVWAKNALNTKQNRKFLDSDPFNADVMDELELLLIQETTHDGNVDFITQMKSLLDEDPPPPLTSPLNGIQSPPQPLQSTPLKTPVRQKSPQNDVTKDSDRREVTVKSADNKLPFSGWSRGRLPKVWVSHQLLHGRRSVEIRSSREESSPTHTADDNRRRSYAEVVAQKVNGGRQALMDELKSSISARAKSYADVVSTTSTADFELIRETKIPILRAKSHLSPLKQSLRPAGSQSNSPTHHHSNGSPKNHSLIETNHAITSHMNSNNLNKSLSKIPLPVKQSSEPTRPHSSESTTSEDSMGGEDQLMGADASSPTMKTPLSESGVKSSGKPKNGAIRSSKLRRRVNELTDELKRGMSEKSLLTAENESIRKHLLELNEKIQRESSRNYELEKKLIKLEAELIQYRVEVDMKCKENTAIKTELATIVTDFDDNQRQCHYLEAENQKMLNQIKSMKYEEEVLHQKLTQQGMSGGARDVCAHEEVIIEWKSKVDELNAQNERLRGEADELQRVSVEKRLEYERELFEWQKRNLDIESDLKRLQLEMQVNSIKPSPEEQLELIKAVRDLNHLMAKLDDRITRNEESQQFKARTINEEMFDCARNLLDQMRAELTNFKDMLNNTANRDNKTESEERQLSAFESRIAELRSSLERLEDQIQSQELQLFRQSDIISLATPLRKSSSSRELFISTNNKPKSWFVQTLFRLQSHIQSTTPTGDTITAFVHQKTRLQKQIHELKSELGIFAESVH